MALPVIKIDEPMARRALATGRRIGVVASFPATVATTTELLVGAEVKSICVPEALQALFHGDRALHDRMIQEAAAQLGTCDAIVLAQVSMAHLVNEIASQLRLPVLGSLDTSLAAILEVAARA